MKRKTKNSLKVEDMEKWALNGISAIMEADSLESAVKSTATKVFNTIGEISRSDNPDKIYDINHYINCMRDDASEWLAAYRNNSNYKRYVVIRDHTLLFWDAVEELIEIYWENLRGDKLISAIRDSSLYDITTGDEGVPREIEALGNIISYLHDWVVSWQETGKGCMFEQ